jgi:hypothetical protein
MLVFERGLHKVVRQTLGQHALLLDEAVDCWVKAKIAESRGRNMFGCGIASDESPPASHRFTGYRFQVTYVYIPFFKDENLWESSLSPPLRCEKLLLDVCHCDGKDGVSVMRVISKQLDRLGLNQIDIVSGCGDGGGENEGMSGVHNSFETSNPSYVRRRCLGHLAWRAADAGINAYEVQFKQLKQLCAYLHFGITMRRLKVLSTIPIAQGGLGLLREGSAEYLQIFNTSPGHILDGRPETAAHFLAWLVHREHILAPAVARDVSDRTLAEGADVAKLVLEDPLGRVTRCVYMELLERSLFLFRWCKKYVKIALNTNLRDLLQKAISLITSLDINDHFLVRFKLSAAELVAKGCHRNRVCVHVVHLHKPRAWHNADSILGKVGWASLGCTCSLRCSCRMMCCERMVFPHC